MKKATILMLLLAFLCSSCTPSLVPGENWVRSVFAPSGAARDQACKIGYRVGEARNLTDKNLPGIIDFPTGAENLRFYTAVGGAHLFCFIFGLGRSGLPDGVPAFTTFANLQNTQMTLENVDLSIELRGEKDVVLGSIGLSKKLGTDQEIDFSMPELTKQDLNNLDLAKNFDLVLKENEVLKRFTVNAGSGRGLF